MNTSLLNLIQNKKIELATDKVASDVDASSQSAVGKELTVRKINPSRRDKKLSSRKSET